MIGVSLAAPAHAQTTDAQKAVLEAELKQLELEIAAQEGILNSQKNQSASFQRDVEILRAKINKAKAKIKARDLEINKIGKEINRKEDKIDELGDTIVERTEALAEMLRRTSQLDDQTLIYAVFSQDKISDYYVDVDSYASIKKSVRENLFALVNDKEETEEEKIELAIKRNDEIDKKKEVEREKATVETSESQQKVLLNISKNKEAEYEAVLKQRQAKAASIRAALFELRDQKGISFGDAYEFAKVASAGTGVRPAYILAILTQESNLGNNVGTCNRPGDTRTWRDIMPGPEHKSSGRSWRDDQSAFLRITKKLGISADGQALSCPLAWGGWGGAMGPSQFIPVTWESYEKRIEQVMNVSVANPWNPQHAITATALYVKDLGASAQTFTAEREAACKYYSGRGCSNPKVKNLFYGNAVMAHADKIQASIDVLESF